MSSQYFLGLDAGGTKTHALIANETGQVLGFAQEGPGNWQSVGFDNQRDVFKSITRQVLDIAGDRDWLSLDKIYIIAYLYFLVTRQFQS